MSEPFSGAVTVAGGRPLRGIVRAPGDKSISHRALILGGLAEGSSSVVGLSGGEDVARTLEAMRAFGAEVLPGGWAGSWTIEGGRSRLRRPVAAIDVGNSGTGIRLLAGVAASLPFRTELTGDASVRRRPMDRVVSPLRAMGARITGACVAGAESRAGSDNPDGAPFAPLVIDGGGLHGIDYAPPVASAQVKSAVLLAGLAAAGETVVRERLATRRHTEEMLVLAGADVAVEELPGGGLAAHVRASELQPFDLEVPSDPSQAAFWIVGACVTPGSEVVCERVYVGPGRAGFLDVLRRMGADVEIHRRDGTTADIVARYGPLRATEVGGQEVPGLIDEVPALAVAAACAEGRTTFRDVGELRVKESDRITTITQALEALGGRVEALPDAGGLAVTGGRLHGGVELDSAGDHRIAMAAAVAALTAEEPVVVAGWDVVATSYPGFADDLRILQGR